MKDDLFLRSKQPCEQKQEVLAGRTQHVSKEDHSGKNNNQQKFARERLADE